MLIAFNLPQSFTHALYHLAANPEYIDTLREEVDAVIAEEGWSKTALGRMWRLDSFMRESLRHNSINPCMPPRHLQTMRSPLTSDHPLVTVRRKALKTFAFSDGTVIPRGTVLVTPPYATHLDEDNFENAAAFEPWRFAHEKERDNSPAKHQFVTTSTEYVGWGHGKHAWYVSSRPTQGSRVLMAIFLVPAQDAFSQQPSSRL